MAKFSLFPKGEKFMVMLEESAQNAVKISQQLNDMLHIWENVRERVGIINDFEHQGDAITHQIMAQLNTTLITPYDREDIAALAHSLDDVTDCVHSAAETMLMYDVKNPDICTKEMSGIILQAATEVQKAISEMHNKMDPKKVLEHCIEINRLENLNDGVYRNAMAGLFTESCDIASVIKWREIYGHLESAVDRCEDISNILEGISIKYA